MKECIKCGDEFPDTPEYFHRRGNELRLDCKVCTRKRYRIQYKKNKKSINKRNKKWYEENKEVANKRNRKRYKKYYKINKDTIRIKTRNRKILKKLSGKGTTVKEWAHKILEYNGRCAYCGIRLEENLPNIYNPNGISQDHVIPLDKGGKHEIDNVVPCCRDCNTKKKNKLDWKKLKIFGKELKLA